MDWSFTPHEEQFRTELRAFLVDSLPADWQQRSFALPQDSEERLAIARDITRQLSDRSWLAPAWPRRFGGLDATHMQQLIFNEETSYQAMPGGGGLGVSLVGPAIMQYGNDQQKDLYLPRITGADDVWCVLQSESDSGSDLASLQTSAVRDGDFYVINGRKTWISGGHNANMGWLAARTNTEMPRHRGISTFIVPMDTPGITVHPSIDMTGEHNLNEVHLDDVRVPAENLVGEENRGWYQLAAPINFERSGVQSFAHGKRNVERLLSLAKEGGPLLSVGDHVRYELADRWLELEVGFNIAYRIPWMQSQQLVTNAESAVSRLYGAELTQRIAGTGMKLLGLAGQLAPGSDNAPFSGAMSRSYLAATSSTIQPGTVEVQRNVIAQHGLGLPRG